MTRSTSRTDPPVTRIGGASTNPANRLFANQRMAGNGESDRKRSFCPGGFGEHSICNRRVNGFEIRQRIVERVERLEFQSPFPQRLHNRVAGRAHDKQPRALGMARAHLPKCALCSPRKRVDVSGTKTNQCNQNERLSGSVLVCT